MTNKQVWTMTEEVERAEDGFPFFTVVRFFDGDDQSVQSATAVCKTSADIEAHKRLVETSHNVVVSPDNRS